MNEEKIFSGETTEEVWKQLKDDLNGEITVLEYNAILEQGNRRVLFSVDIDPGGGFESGYALCTFSAPLSLTQNLHLTIHKEGLLDEAGKLLGMQDVEIGYPEFDKKVIIKTNNEEKIKTVFSSQNVRAVIGQLKNYTLKIRQHKNESEDDEKPFLELTIENNIPSVAELKVIYEAFSQITASLENLE
ncbi:MAG TPA: hypothetical protein VM888_13150 [Chitinophagaceae bacterium]|nr:hypothetical protein [Chitinophagaceae bacterium]